MDQIGQKPVDGLRHFLAIELSIDRLKEPWVGVCRYGYYHPGGLQTEPEQYCQLISISYKNGRVKD